jgi:hypothetical protein
MENFQSFEMPPIFLLKTVYTTVLDAFAALAIQFYFLWKALGK